LFPTLTCMPFVTALAFTTHSTAIKTSRAHPNSMPIAVELRPAIDHCTYGEPHSTPSSRSRTGERRKPPFPSPVRSSAACGRPVQANKNPYIDSADAGRGGGGGSSSFPPTARPRGLVRVSVRVMVMVMVRARARAGVGLGFGLGLGLGLVRRLDPPERPRQR